MGLAEPGSEVVIYLFQLFIKGFGKRSLPLVEEEYNEPHNPTVNGFHSSDPVPL